MARGGERLALVARRGSGGFVPRRAARASMLALLCVLAVFLAAGLCFAGPAAAKSYVIDDVRIVAAVKANGDLLVGEQRTFAFDGSYHYVYWDIATQGSRGVKVLGVDGPDGPMTTARRRARERATPSSARRGR